MTRRKALLLLPVLAVLMTTAFASSQAATPSKGTVSTKHAGVRWHGSGWVVGAGYALNLAGIKPEEIETVCPPEAADPAHQQCDHFHLHVDVPMSYWKKHPGGVKVSVGWPDPGNKILMGVYDSDGNWLGYGYGSDPASFIIANAHGDYDIAVEPLIVTHQTGYDGYARIVKLPRTMANPSVGGPAAWHPVRDANPNPDAPPANQPVAYSGPQVRLVGHDIGATTLEPTIGMTKRGAIFEGGIRGGGATGLYGYPPELRRSTDGGVHWVDGGVGAASAHNSSNDPFLYVDPDTGRVFWLDQIEVNGAALSYSDDDGKTWTNTVISTGINDHPTLVTGVVPEGTGLALADPKMPKVVYYCSNAVASADCQRSLTGGLTWSKIGSPFVDQSQQCPAVGTEFAHLTTDRIGRVFLGAGNCGTPEVAYSEDAGLTWTNVVVSRNIHTLGHDVETAVDTAGNVYAVWTDDQASLPYMSVSRDHGRTWSTPMMVAPPGVVETSYVTVTTGTTGRVAISLVGTQVNNTADTHRPWAFYTSITQNALAPSPLFVSNSADLDNGTRVLNRGGCCDGFRDFLGSARSPLGGGAVISATGMACTAKCAKNQLGVNDTGKHPRGYTIIQTQGPALWGPRRAL